MTQYVKKLPAVFQTVTEKKFFDATFDQVLSKKDSSYLAGYLGRRVPGSYNPITDFYLPEPSKNRTWWQLEPTAFSRNPDTSKTNVFFYEDLLDNIEYYGGNTLNQDRLFNSEYYSFGPPIDYDMFINYHNYYWIDQRLPSITITGVMASDIIGQSTYTTPPTATPANFTLSTGMSIILADDPDYLAPHTVENFGGCEGLQLVPYFTDITAGATFEFLPWDGMLTLSNGRTIDNTHWDFLSWDTEYQPSSGDYITIQRGSLNRNAWSRTNKWYHIDTIKAVVAQTGFPFPATTTRALRPIIQFVANLELYKSGTQFNSEIDYGFKEDVSDNVITLASMVGQQVSNLNITYGISMSNGDLVCFFDDTTPLNVSLFPWDTVDWDIEAWDEIDFTAAVNQFIWEVVVSDTGSVSFNPHTAWTTPVQEGDIVIVREDGPGSSAQAGETWYFENSVWQKAFNDKTSLNQPPLFILYDHTGTPLDDSTKYPDSSFEGSKVFSYKVNPEPGATVDPVLKFPIVYTGLGQATDIVFQNNLITDRYVYSNVRAPIEGYYYYKQVTNPILENSWNLYQPCPCDDIIPPPPCNCLPTSKQRVIDKYVVGYGTQYQFQLSVEPYGYPASPDLVVSVNDSEVKNASEQPNGYTFITINNRLYIDLSNYLTTLLTTTQSQAPVVEIQTYTHGLLDPAATGYSAIPQQLEANPNQEEVSELSGSDLTQHFSSIIANQIDFSGVAFGGPTNYRDTRKNRSVGQFILQNVNPLLKAMLVAPQGDLSFFDGIRFSADEYSKFKNKYLKIALQLINQQFNPVQYQNNTVVISAWVEEILKMINISKEFSNAFAYSYMIANGSPYISNSVTVPIGGLITLTGYVDLSDPKNALYVYDVTGQEKLLIIGEDYEIVSTNLAIDIQINTANVPVGSSLYVALYKNPLPAYIPSTPSKIGAYPVYVPRIEWDTTYVNPTWVIVGHDGSKTVAYGDYDPLNEKFDDYRDALLLELERRIYNLIQYRFRHEHYLPIRIESVKTGFFRAARYSREEYLEITESYLNKWSAKNRANYRANDWVSASATAPVTSLWKLYNYSDAVNSLDQPLNLPGNWKGIFQYMYDTYYPDTRPWEMLGFSAEPTWWRYEYGNPVTNLAGQEVWTSTAAGAHVMYADLEAGIIRQGPSAIYDPVTELVQPQAIWARPGLSSYIPVDAAGELRPILDVTNPANSLFDVAYSGNPYEPFDGFDNAWVYGDGAPVEQAWMSTSNYAFAVQEFLMLMRPAPYGEYMWDTLGTELSPGYITVPASTEPVMTDVNWQFVQNDTFTSDDEFFHWMRPKNKDQIVHAESIDTEIQIRYGYQRWISDRILFLGKDIGETFGQKVRTLDVNLANKLAGFTNKDTTNTYIESVTPGSLTNSLIIPSTNFDVLLHKSPVVERYAYSGVVVRALGDGTFVVYGYDLLASEFTILNRSTSKLIDISVGGTPSPFVQFSAGATYASGDIVRYNGVYYLSQATQTVSKFVDGSWQKLKALPTIGGVSVTYKPVSEETITKVPYGTVLTSVQEVFDLLIGWGAWLEAQGWQFTEVNPDTNQLSDWLYAGKQFLFWLNSEWAPDASIQLSPLANKATLIAKRGYPDDVETMSNGVYSILDKYGVAISPQGTITDRDGRLISVEPADLAVGGIYFLQVNVSETEHILIFDNETNFADTIYSPLLRARQQRLRFNGFRTNGWYGKMEAPGYLVIDNQLVPNYDTIVNDMRYYYDPNTTIDNPSLEDLGRHLIGYKSKSYLDNLQVSNDVQYLFYQGAIRQKGTIQALDKLFRSTKIQSDENIEIYEEWALKLADFGNTVEQVSTEFVLVPEQNTGEVVVARLNFKPSDYGFVRQINIINAVNIYTTVPTVYITAPASYVPGNRQAKAYAVLGSDGRISRIDITDPGYGYIDAPAVYILSTENINTLDQAYAVYQGAIQHDPTLDNIIDIDVDEVDRWTVRPVDPSYSLEFPTTKRVDYPMPNAGYVNFNDVDFSSFDVEQTVVNWGTLGFNPSVNKLVWVAKTFTEDWDVYKIFPLASNGGLIPAPETFSVINDSNNNLWLRTPDTYKIGTQGTIPTSGNYNTDFGNLIVLQVTGKQATAIANIKPPTQQATATAFVPIPAEAIVTSLGGALNDRILIGNVTISENGNNYSSAPAVSIDPPAKSQASITSTFNATTGVVNSLTITDPGLGYTTGSTITFDLPTPTTAQAEAIIDAASGTVTGINIIDGGLGYYPSDPPTVTIESAGENPTISIAISPATGSVISAQVVNPSAGLSSATIALGTWPGNGGGGANATAVLGPDGKVSSVFMVSGGGGYSSPPSVTFGGPIKTQSNLTAFVSGGYVTAIGFTAGQGYVGTPTVTVAPPTKSNATGSAAVATTPGPVTSISLGSGGSGYATAPSVTISGGGGSGATATATVANGVVTGLILTAGGTGYTSAPTVSIGAPDGTPATAIATVNPSTFQISGVTVTSQGSGYASAPTVTISAPDAQSATGYASVSFGTVSGITLTSGGSGYPGPGAPSISIGGPTGGPATLTANIVNGSLSSVTITNAGGGYTSTPAVTVTGTFAPPATASVATYLGGSIQSITVTSPGVGYKKTPKVTISAPVAVQATGTVVTNTGKIVTATITNGGKGYTNAPGVTVSAPNGVTATATSTISSGSVTALTITNQGSGYSSIPLIGIAPCPYANQVTGLPGPAGQLIVTNPGQFFPRLTAPVVTILGDGVGATAEANMDPGGSGAITSIDITNAGTGYTYATVVIEAPPESGNGEIESVTIVEGGAGYSKIPAVTVTDPTIGAGGASLRANILDGSVSSITVVSQGTGYEDPTIAIALPDDLTPSSNYAVGFSFDYKEAGYNYYKLLKLDGTQITSDEIDNFASFDTLSLFKTMRFLDLTYVPTGSYILSGDKFWCDGFTPATNNLSWKVYTYNAPSDYSIYRQQENLIDTPLFESATIYDTKTSDMLALLPVYDPFKNILPGPAIQNITYTTLRDPATYNVSPDASLFSENITFGERQVGQLWWDLSSTRYVYYEQPLALNPDGTPAETATDNLVYRRDWWGNLFPGSTVAIYEWVKSSVPPAQYAGTGTPRYQDSYVQLTTINKFTNIPETSYYFWVLNPTGKPNLPNRTMAANDVSRLLQSPKSQNFAFFAPIQQSDINNSYIFYNVQEILAYRGSNVQVQYRLGQRNDQAHTQWMFFRQGDTTSIVTDQYWDKLVDSLCGYTKVLPVSTEYSNSILVYENIPTAWDNFPWDILSVDWDQFVENDASLYGEILPVPDSTLTEAEKYGIQYRPRQGMFVKLQAARKVFVQSANELLKYIPVRDDNPTWNANVSTSIYWTYTNWYKAGYEDVTPNVVFQTLTEANNALVADQLQVDDIVQVIDGTTDGRYVLYAVVQLNPNVSTLSLDKVGIENSAIKLLDTIYTTVNRYDLSVELRELLNAFRTEVMIDENLVDQNEMYFSMLNYVLSEQKNPDWVFKSSYIYIKERNVPLVEDQLYIPDQINHIIDYIVDAKPYHTQIRDYSSEYTYADVAQGTAFDPHLIKAILKFGPQEIVQLDPDDISLNAQTFVDLLNQFVSGDSDFNLDTISVDLTTPDPGKKGYSSLFPYTFSYLGNPPTQNNPQTFIAPESIVAVRADNTYLLSGYDYYTEYNSIDETYTVYFYNDPSVYTTLQAVFWFNGGQFQNITFNTYRNETALGFPEDDLVINVDTKLPANDVSAIVGPSWAPATVAPLVGWGTGWDGINDPQVSTILLAEGGTDEVPWDTPINPVILDYTISSKENTSEDFGQSFIRNENASAGELVEDLPAPTAETENLGVIIVTHPTDIFPNPAPTPTAVWIDGERIEYRTKTQINSTTWELGWLRRGTENTAATTHTAMVPTVANPLVLVPNKVWIERTNYMPVGSNETVWQATNTLPDLSTEQVYPADPPAYTSVTAVPLGGMWYSITPQASFLKNGQGKSIP